MWFISVKGLRAASHLLWHREFLFLPDIVARDDVRPVYAGAETDRMVDEGEIPKRRRKSESLTVLPS